MRLEETVLYQRLRLLAANDHEVNALLVRVEQAFREAAAIARTVIRILPEYTLHDEVHLVGVVDLMGRLLPEPVLDALKPLEIAALILSGGLHDVGMAPPADEVEHFLAGITADTPTPKQLEYRRLREQKPDLVKRKDTLSSAGRIQEAVQVESYLLAEYIRITHGQRTYHMVHQLFSQYCRYAELDFTDILARVCRSHTEDPAVLERLPCFDLVRRPGERCNWRFVAVLLRLADVLDFDPKRTPATLFRHLGVRDPVSIAEWRKHRQIAAWDIGPKRIAFRADCEDPVIEDTIRAFIRVIEGELRTARSILGNMHHPALPGLAVRYDLLLPAEVDSNQVGPIIGPSGPVYHYVDVRFRLEHDAILGILMGLALYGERHLFLRELLQNSVDACRHRRAIADSRGIDYQPRVTVSIRDDGGNRILVVDDNGMGMSSDIVERYFARIGKSYYRSADFAATRFPAGSFRPISQFGIGVLSSFMAGDHLTVETLHASRDIDHKAAESLWVEIADQGALFWLRPGNRAHPGTAVSIRLAHPTSELLRTVPSHSVNEADEDVDRLTRTVAEFAPHVEFPIVCEGNGRHVEVVREYRVREIQGWGLNFLNFEIDLTADAPDGIDGRIIFGLLTDEDGALLRDHPGQGAVRDHNGGFAFAPGWGSGYWFQAVFGGIEGTEWTMQNSGRTGHSRPFVHASGTLSQDGFLVPHALFSMRGTPPTAVLPFACSYAINLSGEFRLPLTADRTRIPNTVEATENCDKLVRILTTLMLRRIEPVVRKNVDYFRKIVRNDQPRSESIYLEVLDSILQNGG
jgi:hypothetical protein